MTHASQIDTARTAIKAAQAAIKTVERQYPKSPKMTWGPLSETWMAFVSLDATLARAGNAVRKAEEKKAAVLPGGGSDGGAWDIALYAVQGLAPGAVLEKRTAPGQYFITRNDQPLSDQEVATLEDRVTSLGIAAAIGNTPQGTAFLIDSVPHKIKSQGIIAVAALRIGTGHGTPEDHERVAQWETMKRFLVAPPATEQTYLEQVLPQMSATLREYGNISVTITESTPATFSFAVTPERTIPRRDIITSIEGELGFSALPPKVSLVPIRFTFNSVDYNLWRSGYKKRVYGDGDPFVIRFMRDYVLTNKDAIAQVLPMGIADQEKTTVRLTARSKYSAKLIVEKVEEAGVGAEAVFNPDGMSATLTVDYRRVQEFLANNDLPPNLPDHIPTEPLAIPTPVLESPVWAHITDKVLCLLLEPLRHASQHVGVPFLVRQDPRDIYGVIIEQPLTGFEDILKRSFVNEKQDVKISVQNTKRAYVTFSLPALFSDWASLVLGIPFNPMSPYPEYQTILSRSLQKVERDRAIAEFVKEVYSKAAQIPTYRSLADQDWRRMTIRIKDHLLVMTLPLDPQKMRWDTRDDCAENFAASLMAFFRDEGARYRLMKAYTSMQSNTVIIQVPLAFFVKEWYPKLPTTHNRL